MILRRPHAVAPERRPAGAPDERREFRISVQPRRRGPLPLPGAAALYVRLCAKMKRVYLKSIQLLEPYGQSLLEDLRYLLLSSCAAKHPEIWSRDSSGRHDCHLSLVSTCMSHTTCPHTVKATVQSVVTNRFQTGKAVCVFDEALVHILSRKVGAAIRSRGRGPGRGGCSTGHGRARGLRWRRGQRQPLRRWRFQYGRRRRQWHCSTSC